MFDILFKNICVVNPDEALPVQNNMYLGVRDGKIAYLSNKEPEEGAVRTIDGRNKALIPGLVNTHTHAAMSILRGYADDYNLQDWLHNYVFPAEAKLDERCVYIGTQLAIAEMIRTGTVSITDMYMYIPAVARMPAMTYFQ
jgi:5-methylthioadenosine/S-adenosylhomocysteine deaminase